MAFTFNEFIANKFESITSVKVSKIASILTLYAGHYDAKKRQYFMELLSMGIFKSNIDEREFNQSKSPYIYILKIIESRCDYFLIVFENDALFSDPQIFDIFKQDNSNHSIDHIYQSH